MENNSPGEGLDDSELFRHRYSPVCTWCRNRHYGPDHTCKAFPSGIPDEIWEGKNDHTAPYEGDRGFRFVANKFYKPQKT